MTRKVAVVVGSIRKESINRKLAKALVKLAPKDFECDFVKIDDLPVFNQDHDQNPPESVLRVKGQVMASNAFLFITPEHNRSLPTALKNVLDWVSRPYGKNLWAGKPAGLAGIIVFPPAPKLSNNIIQKGLAFLREESGSVTVPGARRASGSCPAGCMPTAGP